jgi:response regulator RpfG family c-di-GMP phosphodiesterase
MQLLQKERENPFSASLNSQPAVNVETTVLIVDDEEMIRELLATTLGREGYSCLMAENADEGLRIISSNKINLMICDIMMPGRSGVELLHDVKKVSPDTAVLMVTAISDTETAMFCIHRGADDYIIKPFNIERVILTVRNSLEKQRLMLENRAYQANLEMKVLEQTKQILATMYERNRAYEDTLIALIKALDARETETGSHSERVMAYTVLLAEELGVNQDERMVMAKGAMLHDIGKIGISDNILLKPGKLTEIEWDEMKRHPQLGYDILSDIKYLSAPAAIILSHHERWDGTGYPHGLAREAIPLGSRIFAFADTLDAMTSDRPYRKALSFDTVLSEVTRCSGSQFDPEIAKVFLTIPWQRWQDAVGEKR